MWNLYSSGEQTLFLVGGEPVTEEEFGFYLQKVTPVVRETLQRESQRESQKEMQEFKWSNKVNGKIGYEYLAEEAKKYAVSFKVIQREAKALHLVSNTDYSWLMRQREQENKERKAKKEQGETVYGVVEYSKEEYYNYFNSNLELRYQEKLINDAVLTVTEEESRTCYEANLSYFDNQTYDTVRDSAKKLALEEKYKKYLENLKGKSKITNVKEEAVINTVKKAFEKTS